MVEGRRRRRFSLSSQQLALLLLLLSFFLCFSVASPRAISDSDLLDETVANSSSSVASLNASSSSSLVKPKEGSFADIIDRALEKEFNESDQNEVADPGSFNNSVAGQQFEYLNVRLVVVPCGDQAVLETVARVKSTKKNETKEEKRIKRYLIFHRRFQLHDVFNLNNDNRAEDTPTLIDRKVSFYTGRLSLDLLHYFLHGSFGLVLISDLVVVIVSATCGGIAFACAGQPVITGYLLAGSIIGPGGLNFISEMVQVETVAQFGVVFLLFALGLEFSTAKLCGGKRSEGVFVGAFLSMSSTAVVLKFLMEKNSTNSLHGQVTIGILILQDCAVGLLFALLPVLEGNSGIVHGMLSIGKGGFVAFVFGCFVNIITDMYSLVAEANGQLIVTDSHMCVPSLIWSWCVFGNSSDKCSDKLGLSLELGSFAAGVMISTTDLAEHTLEQIEPIRNLFAALFLASIGMLVNVHFLWTHVDILLASVILVIIIKTTIVTTVVKGFGYNNKTALLVGISLAQIGEFAFVLLSRASNLHLIEGKLYLLLLGTTALSLVTTPLVFKMIPAVVHLGILLKWFSPDSTIEKGEIVRSESGKQRMILMSRQSHSS
ncbi:putative potassium transport protein [Arabidopsis thaliana]|nr:putative potassium transport protein [Arabidopsis thaliana]